MRLFEICVQSRNALATNPGASASLEGCRESFVWPFAAKATYLVSLNLIQIPDRFFFCEMRLNPAGRRSRIDALRSFFSVGNGIISGNSEHAPVAIAEKENEFGSVSSLADGQTRNPTYFLSVDKEQSMARVESYRVVQYSVFKDAVGTHYRRRTWWWLFWAIDHQCALGKKSSSCPYSSHASQIF